MNRLQSRRRWNPVPSRLPSRRDRSRSRFLPRPEGLEDRTLLSPGDLDPTFGLGGKVRTDIGRPSNDFATAVTAVQADGKIVVAGQSDHSPGDFVVVRYNPDGSLDAGFGSQGSATIDFGGTDDFGSGVAVDSQGRIVVAGQ